MSALLNTYAAVGALYSFWTIIQAALWTIVHSAQKKELRHELQTLRPMPSMRIAIIVGIAAFLTILAMVICAALWPLFLVAELLLDDKEEKYR